MNTLGTRFPKYTGNIDWDYLWVVGTKSNLEKVQIQMESCASVWIGWSICFYFSHNFFPPYSLLLFYIDPLILHPRATLSSLPDVGDCLPR